MTKTIRVWFADMWGHGEYHFNPRNNYFLSLLNLRYDVILDQVNPQVLFFSCFGEEYKTYTNSLKIFFCGENYTPPGIDRMVKPDYSRCDISISQFSNQKRNYYFPLWALFVNWFYDTVPLPLPSNPTYLISPGQLLSSRSTYYGEKINDCAFINNNPIPDRIELYKTLSQRISVDSYGKLYNNVGYILGGDEAAKIQILKTTKTCISYENTFTIGYNTEKIIQPYSVGSIAIYSGGLDRTVFNSGSLFYKQDYNSTLDKIGRAHV